MESTIEDLKKKVNNIEYKEIKELKDELCNVKLSLNQNNILTENCIKSNEKMSATLDSVRETMIIISESVKQSNTVSKELADSVKSLGGQVTKLDDKMEEKFIEVDDKINSADKEVNKKINEINDKSKFDILDFVRQNWVAIIIGAGILGYLFLK